MPSRDRVKQPKEPSSADTNTSEVKKAGKQTKTSKSSREVGQPKNELQHTRVLPIRARTQEMRSAVLVGYNFKSLANEIIQKLSSKNKN